jgi:riboflavin kinase/FMN adenylyltransferase
MQIHHSLEFLPKIPSPVVTVGSFDGVHKGHRTIIQRLNALAEGAGGASVLITFSPHPRKVLYPDTAGKDLKMINSLPEKCLLLEEAGLDHLVILEFTREFARTTSEEFVRCYLVGKLHAHTIVVGFNHFFGFNKEGSYDSLYNSRERYGYRVEEIPEQEIQNETVSSTQIRKALRDGNIQRANAYLEHIFMVHTHLERKSVPSARTVYDSFEFLPKDDLKLLPPEGAYAASILAQESSIKGLVQISGSGNFIYPLFTNSSIDEGQITIRFHKRIESGKNSELDDLLNTVQELIY